MRQQRSPRRRCGRIRLHLVSREAALLRRREEQEPLDQLRRESSALSGLCSDLGISCCLLPGCRQPVPASQKASELRTVRWGGAASTLQACFDLVTMKVVALAGRERDGSAASSYLGCKAQRRYSTAVSR